MWQIYKPAKEFLQELLYCYDYLDWKDAGIESVSDLSRNGGTFMLKEQLENKFKIQIPFMKYYQIISSMKVVSNNIPKNKSTLRDKDNKICNICLNNLHKVITRLFK